LFSFSLLFFGSPFTAAPNNLIPKALCIVFLCYRSEFRTVRPTLLPPVLSLRSTQRYQTLWLFPPAWSDMAMNATFLLVLNAFFFLVLADSEIQASSNPFTTILENSFYVSTASFPRPLVPLQFPWNDSRDRLQGYACSTLVFTPVCFSRSTSPFVSTNSSPLPRQAESTFSMAIRWLPLDRLFFFLTCICNGSCKVRLPRIGAWGWLPFFLS